MKDKSKRPILIVEDDAVVRDIMRNTLDNHYRIFEASTYLEAIKFPPQSFDLAIIDYILPDRDGFDVLTSLRQRNPHIHVIMMTGFGSEEIIIRALRNNVADFFRKPLNLAYLKRRIPEILVEERRRKGHTEPASSNNHLDNIAKHIQDNYMEELSLEKLSRLACMSRFSFCRAFKERFDQCCISYVNSIRIQNAVRLLQDPRFSITEIAFSVGYRNSGHFNRVFKETYKISPREYRKKMILSNQEAC